MKPKLFLGLIIFMTFFACQNANIVSNQKVFNSVYTGENLSRLAFPIGGIGAGMFCLEGSGAISHVSVRNNPDIFNEPFTMAALSIKGLENGAKVLEGPVPGWKNFGNPNTGNGAGDKSYGFPRFDKASFKTKFPFGKVKLEDKDIPMEVSVTGWSPFIPTDEDNSSLPVGGLEYTFKNTSREAMEACFSYHAENFMRMEIPSEWGGQYEKSNSIAGIKNGFLLQQNCLPDKPYYKGDFAIMADDPNTVVDLCWFRGGWFDSRTVLWKDLTDFTFTKDNHLKFSGGFTLRSF